MKRALIPVLVAAALAALAGPAAAAGCAKISTSTSKFGRILVDGKGRTLYLFRKDTGGRSACAGACATEWPPVITHGKPRAGGAAKASRLGTTRRGNGSRQVTYRGHPLYRFIGDTRRGQTHGQGLFAFGAAWYVVSPSGRALAGY